MTYQDLFLHKSILDAIPMKMGDKKLATPAVSSVILLQVAYQTKIDEFNSTMQDVLMKLKKDGFDERMQKHSRYEELCGKTEALTNDESKEKSELSQYELDFGTEFEELNYAYLDAYNKKINEEIPELKKLSQATFSAIIDIMNFDEKISLASANGKTIEIPQDSFLSMIGYNLVEND